jgi:hypothetical protein
MMRRLISAAIFLAAATPGVVRGQQYFEAGRFAQPGKYHTWDATVGSALDFKAISEQFAPGAASDTGDFEMGSSFAFGTHYRCIWDFVTFDFLFTVVQPDDSAVASRDYFLDVDDKVSVNGESYGRMVIPAGTSFSSEFLGALSEFNWAFTPVDTQPGDAWWVTPYLDAGFLTLVGQYDIDAGEPTGTYPGADGTYAIGGKSGGMTGLFTPQVGPGIETRIGNPDGVNLVMEASYLLWNFGLDLEHSNFRFRATLELPPFASGASIDFGILAQMIDTENESEDDGMTERFVLESSSVMAAVGATF